MKNIGIIGRCEWLYFSMNLLEKNGFHIKFIITSKEAPEYKITSSDFENFAKKRKIPFLLKSKIGIEDINNLGLKKIPDICVSANYTGIIDKPTIELFPLGILNAHGGDLPNYKGNACQAWALINGENNIGICIHKMIGGEIDSGDIVSREYLPIDLGTKIGDVYSEFEKLIPKLFLESLNKLNVNPNYFLEKQNNSKKGIRCYPRTPVDGRIQWSDDNKKIIRLINASNYPYSGAYCYLVDKKIVIRDAEIYSDNEKYFAIPGQISSVERDGSIIVISGNGKIKINSIEIDQKIIMPSSYVKSIRKRFI